MTSKQQWQMKGLCLLALKRGATAAAPGELMRAAMHVMRTSPARQITRNNALWLADSVAEFTHRQERIRTRAADRVLQQRAERNRRQDFVDLMEEAK